MKRALLLMLLALAAPVFTAPVFSAPACAAPVHVTLKAAAAVAPDAAGFFALGSVADLSGGAKDARERMASVPVGRVPLSGATRLLTGGDICLKLRQAGFHPDTDAVVGGAPQATVTAAQEALTPQPPLPLTQARGSQSLFPTLACEAGEGRPSAGGVRASSDAALLIHPGDPVNIVVQSDALTVTARGVARQAGRPGDAIRVHREGVMTDLTVTVVDAQTVQLEM